MASRFPSSVFGDYFPLSKYLWEFSNPDGSMNHQGVRRNARLQEEPELLRRCKDLPVVEIERPEFQPVGVLSLLDSLVTELLHPLSFASVKIPNLKGWSIHPVHSFWGYWVVLKDPRKARVPLQ